MKCKDGGECGNGGYCENCHAQAKEQPILFSAPMVRAILDGHKTQTRRIVKQSLERLGDGDWYAFGHKGVNYRVNARHTTVAAWARLLQFCPYGQPGDRLWVRETFCPIYPQDPTYNGGRPIEYDYAATYRHGYRLGDLLGEKKKWNPSIHMPRCASRITLEITGVRVERLHDINEADATAEGTPHSLHLPAGRTAVENYCHLWECINGDGSWADNPWVWVIEFHRISA